ncbi:BrnT family toxin [Celeribacter sp. PS-C1]|uniref:BrnT family toxin n=1 Tax=Celeribacter sp. PS-C1 TaxID=2820813 RepID=UPI001C675C3D|nr:BrnT family toxin [Celeribacter sp. PS-C1]MBW6419786.1 BrnT family toxin [Celeribacter sp. PS-C1]
MKVTYDLVLDDGSGVLPFEWDANKDLENRKKHGISFEEAAEIFQNDVLTGEDHSSYGERREISFGRLGSDSDAPLILCVVHTDRDGAYRLISARKATSHERRDFDDYFEKTYH